MDSEAVNKVRAGSVCYFTYMLFFKGNNTSVSPSIHPLKLIHNIVLVFVYVWCFPKAGLTPLSKHYKQCRKKIRKIDRSHKFKTRLDLVCWPESLSYLPTEVSEHVTSTSLFRSTLWGYGCMRIFTDCLKGSVMGEGRYLVSF